MLNSVISYQEIDALGNGVVIAYVRRFGGAASTWVDVEGIASKYLQLPIIYKKFAEIERSKVGFLSNGLNALHVWEDGKIYGRRYPKYTIVLDESLLQESQLGRRRFTIAHELAHYLLEKHLPEDNGGIFGVNWDGEIEYPVEEYLRMLRMKEIFADRLAASILMPKFLVQARIWDVLECSPIPVYEGGVFSDEIRKGLIEVANLLQVSFSALVNRLRELELLDVLPMEEYCETTLRRVE